MIMEYAQAILRLTVLALSLANIYWTTPYFWGAIRGRGFPAAIWRSAVFMLCVGLSEIQIAYFLSMIIVRSSWWVVFGLFCISVGLALILLGRRTNLDLRIDAFVDLYPRMGQSLTMSHLERIDPQRAEEIDTMAAESLARALVERV